MSFSELSKKISPTLKRITYRLNGHFTFFNEDDLFQEAQLHLWQEFEAGKLQDKTDSYILQGCYFHLKNYIRKNRIKAGLVSLDNLAYEGENCLEEIIPCGDYRDFFDYLDSKILIEKIQNNGLTEREKKVFSFCLEGLTTRDIGKRMGISHVMVVKLRKNIKERYGKIFQELI